MNPLKKKPRTKNLNPVPEKPEWLRVKLRFPMDSDPVMDVRKNLTETRLNTVCSSAFMARGVDGMDGVLSGPGSRIIMGFE